VRATVEDIVTRETQPIEERLIAQLESIIKSAQDRVFANYRSSYNGDTAIPMNYQVIPASTVEAASTQQDAAANFQNDQSYSTMQVSSPSRSQLDFSQIENSVSTGIDRQSVSDSGYRSSSLVPLSPLQTSDQQIGLENLNYQHGDIGRSQSRGPEDLSESLQASRHDLDWVEVSRPSDYYSVYDTSHTVSYGFEEDAVQDFNWDKFLAQS
jgi:hypothetical protein